MRHQWAHAEFGKDVNFTLKIQRQLSVFTDSCTPRGTAKAVTRKMSACFVGKSTRNRSSFYVVFTPPMLHNTPQQVGLNATLEGLADKQFECSCTVHARIIMGRSRSTVSPTKMGALRSKRFFYVV